MKSKEREQYFTNYLASNGGAMKRTKFMSQLLRVGVISGQNDFERLLGKMIKDGYVTLEDDTVTCLKTKPASPSLEDIYINQASNVKGEVILTPNAINKNPPLLP
ncbi:MAG: hypothetical protein Q4F05_17970 [bacterium]|nr:hypothetical protein [bacterium]